jgi:hypothetical protein
MLYLCNKFHMLCFNGSLVIAIILRTIQGCIQKVPDWPPGARIANGTCFCY